MKGVIKFDKKGKLSPRFVGPYQIIWMVGRVAYDLELPLVYNYSSSFPCINVMEVHKRPSRVVPVKDVHITEDCPMRKLQLP